MQGKKLKFTLRTTAVMLVAAMIITLLPTKGAGFWAKADDINKSVYIVDELKELRTENSKTYLKSDGSRSTVFSSSPMHYEEDGEWLEIDNTFKTVEKDGTEYYQNTAADMNVLLPEKLDETDGVTVENDGYSITVTPKDTDKAAKGKKDKARGKAKDEKRKEMTATELAKEQTTTNGITYNDLYADTDVKYDVVPNGVKESIILNKKPNKHAKYTYKVTADGLAAELKNDGSIDFYSESDEGEVVFTMPAPYMFDSNGVYSYDIKVSLEMLTAGEYELTYTPDYEWLKDKSRAYPVTVDPTIEGIFSTAYRYTNSGFPDKAFLEARVRIGRFNYPTSTPSDYSAYIASPDLTQLGTDKIITSATLHLDYKASSYMPDEMSIGAFGILDDDFDVSDFTYATRPAVTDDPLDVKTVTQDVDLEFDITPLAHNWYRIGGKYGVKLSRVDTQDTLMFYDYDNIYYQIDYKIVSGSVGTDREINLGNAGTVYINDYTGHLRLVRSDIGIDGGVMPVNINFIYNITDVYDNDELMQATGGVTSGTYGRGYRLNYSQCVKYVNAKTPYYKYRAEDGLVYYFDEVTAEDGTVTYEESSGSGYTIEVDTENPTDYTAVTIKDTAEQRYYFDSLGRIIKIVSSAEVAKGVTQSSTPTDGKNYEAGVIAINYLSGMKINTITDGSGRVYRFSYHKNSGLLSAIDYLGYGTTPLRTVSYSMANRSDAGLEDVTYADGKTVKYYYCNDCSNLSENYRLHKLLTAENSDGYKYTFDYEGYSATRISEFAADGTAGEDVTIEYDVNETRFYNTADYQSGVKPIPYEAIRFNKGGEVESCFVYDADSDGIYKINVNYAQSSSSSSAPNDIINLTYSDSNAENLFAGYNVLNGWVSSLGNYLETTPNGINGEQTIEVLGDVSDISVAYNRFYVDGKKDEEYTLAFWVKSSAFALGEKGKLSLTVSFMDENSEQISESTKAIDINSQISEWQYVTAVVSCAEDFDEVEMTVNNDYRATSAYFSGFALYHEAYAYNYHYTDSGELDYIEEISAPAGDEEETEDGETDDETSEEEDTDPYRDETVSEMGIKSISKYDVFGNTIESLVTNGRVSITEKSTYTENGNYLSSTTDSLGNVTSYNYDPELGTLDSVTDAGGNETTYSYNAVGTVTGMSQDVSGLYGGDSLSVTYTYDKGGRVSTINHNNFDYTFSYDAFGVLTSVKAADTTLVTYTYDEDYMPATTVYGNEQTIYYTYDQKGQLVGISTKADEIDRVHFSYDTSGNLTMIYDSANDRRTNFTYDADGNAVTTVRNLLNGVVKHEYKTVGDVFTETVDGNSYAMTYAYDLDGRLTTLSWSNGEATAKKEIHYDDLDRQTSAVISAKNGEETVQILNTSYVYNDTVNFGTSNQVSVLQNKANGYSSTIAYEYDKNGNIVKAGDVSYSYDEAGQLTRVNDPQYGTTVYVYDVGGNIKYVKSYDFTTDELGACTGTITYGYTAEWKDLLTSYNGQQITYDGAGNPLSYRDGMTFTWELGRQLETATHNGKVYSYKYDTDGLRTQKTNGTVTTDFYWADGQLSYQTDGTNDIYFRYDDSGEVIAFNLNGTDYYYVKNLQGDVIAILDGNGNLMVQYTYDAWGKLLNVVDNSDNNLGTINPLRYRGYYYDTELELYYLQSRYYDPQVGRFLNADSVELLGINGATLSYNLFTYCYNNPIINSDFSGNIAANVVGAVIGVVIGIVGGIFLGNWLADTLKLKGWKRGVFVAGVSALVGAAAGAIGYFIGPYVAKVATKLVNYIVQFIQKGKIALSKFSATIRDSLGITKKVVNNLIKQASNLKYSKSAAKHLSSRPYMKSTLTIKNIMQSGKPVIDKSLKNGLKWVVNGYFNGKKGVWELVIDVTTNTIVHFLFRS